MAQSRLSKLNRLLQLAGSLGLLVAALLGGAGRWDWLRGWIFLAAYFGMLGISAAVVLRKNPGLWEARANWRHGDTKRFDKIILALFLPLYYLQFLVAGLDNARFGWEPIPFAAIYPGLILFAAAIAVLAWAMAVNRFAETTVRIQSDRGQAVISTGPYRLVRHPMYVAAISMFLATPLILGSLWALVIDVLLAALFVIRAALEDRALRRELPGYEQYAARTRYRLCPGVW
ncbi:MAG TPA: isoprenylcysteine carboxylmethyltransferase family protein [Bryobacteraceae bacterium]|nr:isoprenylcysteine carboxylmethyltransferase family protein [Bryobacteraceae bacterium]